MRASLLGAYSSGQGAPLRFLTGADIRLSMPKPRQFRGWHGVASFLGGDAEPVPLGAGEQADFECYAPTFARIRRVDWAKNRLYNARALIECRASPVPEDLALVIAAGNAEVPSTIALADMPQTEPGLWEIPLELSSNPGRYSLMLAVSGQVIEQADFGGSDFRSAEDLAPELPASIPPQEAVAVVYDEQYAFHAEIERVGGALFRDGHYKQAAQEAYIRVIAAVKERSRLSLDGDRLINRAFGAENQIPIIQFNTLATDEERDEQKGFLYLFKGIVALRNSKAHTNRLFEDPARAHEYLALASVLLRVLETARMDPRVSSSSA